ncbi:hypothetical protein LSH36_84g00051 [Paralvinella palmiformis]|uniref:Kinesin motor domain-containing protein n=1 Tax=Paralvinella palmiformis TaxID=53620 RepID=A0AAD9K1J4_9ANNE|nr:hypothetical protein LSH36_84g00051 [Paralvinella palmiformis]
MLFCAEESNVWEMLGPVFMADLLETSVRHHPLIWIRSNHAEQDQVANVGPANYNYDETISTLRYANRAKNIKNKAKINEDPKDALLRQFQKEIEELRKQLEDVQFQHISILWEHSDGAAVRALHCKPPGGVDVDASGSEYETDTDEEGTEPDGSPKRRRKKKKGKGLSKEKMLEIQTQIEADRKKLESQKDMAAEEKRKVEEALTLKEKELREAEEEQKMLNQRLAAIEKKIIVGGENLLEKAEEQERLLEQSAKELEERRAKAEELRKALEEKEQVRLDIEEKYSNLQEEVVGKTKKLKRVWTMLMQAKSEIADLQQEHQREMEGLLENVRQLSRELRLHVLIMDSFIPPEYQEMIEQYVHWNEDIGEWQLKCVAYTGNNMRKQTPQTEKDKDKYIEPDLSHVYMAYTAKGAEEAMRPKTGKKSGRPKTANRPKTSKKKRREPNISQILN